MTDRSQTQDKADKALEEMQERSENLGDRIEGAKEDWERKKADDDVPGAGGRPNDAQSGGEPETGYPAKGDTG